MPKLTEIFGIRKEWVEGQPKGGAPRLVDVFEVRNLNEAPESSGYNQFPMDFGSFVDTVEKFARKNFGADYDKVLDRFSGFSGATKQLIGDFFRNHWTVYESISELAVFFDVATNGKDFDMTLEGYPHLKIVRGQQAVGPKFGRTQRPMPSDFEVGDQMRDEPDEFAEGVLREGTIEDNGYDKFPKTFPEFKSELEKIALRNLGGDWKHEFDRIQNWYGAADWAIQQLYDGNYSLYEAQQELSFIWELTLGKDFEQYVQAKIIEGMKTIPYRWNQRPSAWMFNRMKGEDGGYDWDEMEKFQPRSWGVDPRRVADMNGGSDADMREEGVVREAEEDDDGRDPFEDPWKNMGSVRVTREATWDKFPKSFPEYRTLLEQACARDLGPDFASKIDHAHFPGATDWAMQQFWDGFWTLWEAHWEMAFIYECAAANIKDERYYPRAILVQGKNTIGAKEEMDLMGPHAEGAIDDDEIYRDTRPMSAKYFTDLTKWVRKNYPEDDGYDPDPPGQPEPWEHD
jgi:hypothetical protein